MIESVCPVKITGLDIELFSMNIPAFINDLGSVFDNIGDEIRGALSDSHFPEESKEYVLRRLYSGKNADGSDIAPPYTSKTVSIKMRKGQPYDRVTLRDTGYFYSGITFDFDEHGIFLTSTDDKKEKLIGKYGHDIFGVSDDPYLTEMIRDYVRDGLIVRLKKIIKQWLR